MTERFLTYRRKAAFVWGVLASILFLGCCVLQYETIGDALVAFVGWTAGVTLGSAASDIINQLRHNNPDKKGEKA